MTLMTTKATTWSRFLWNRDGLTPLHSLDSKKYVLIREGAADIILLCTKNHMMWISKLRKGQEYE